MAGQPEAPCMDWRAFLKTSEINVFKTIENAILIAATDFPEKFLEKKDHLMQIIINTALSHKSQAPKCIVGSELMKDEKKASIDNTKNTDEGKRNIEEGELVENSIEDIDMKDVKKESEDYNKRDEKGYIEKENHDKDFNDGMNFNTFVKKRKTDVAFAKGDENTGTSVYGTNNNRSIAREWSGKFVAADATYSSPNNVVTVAKEFCAGTLVAKEVKMENEDLTKETDVAKSVLKYKNVLLAMKHQPAVIYDVLKKLDTMELSFEVVQATGIAGVVSSFKANDFREIRLMAEYLIETWEEVFDDWIAKDSNALQNTNEVMVANINEVTLANINEVAGTQAKALKPKSLIGAGYSSKTRTSFSHLSQRPSKPPQAQSSYRTGCRDPAKGIDEVTVAANKHESESSMNARHSWTKRSGSMKNSEGPLKTRCSEPFVSIGFRYAANETIVAGQSAKMYPPTNRKSTSSSSLQIRDASRGNNNTFHARQSRYQLQGPMLTMEEKPDAENKKLETAAPAEKIEEDSVKETLQIAKRTLQERLQKSKQAKSPNIGPQNAEKDTPIGELLSQYRRGPR